MNFDEIFFGLYFELCFKQFLVACHKPCHVNTKLQKAASKAAREILELFNARNKRLSGQNGKMDNEAKEMFKIQDPLNDDKIIQACLQLRKDGKHVQLVSFDNILKIKAHSYQIEIFQTNKLQSVHVAAKKRAAPVHNVLLGAILLILNDFQNTELKNSIIIT